MSAKDLCVLFEKSSTHVLEVSSENIEGFKKSVPDKLPVIKGIMGIRQLFWNGHDLYGRSLSCFECKNKCIHFHVNNIDNFVPHTEYGKKVKLSVSDVYGDSSSSDDLEPPQSETITCNTNYGFLDLKPEVFVVVGFDTGKTVKKFLAVIQGEVSDDREVEVLFLKPTKDKHIFQPDEKDVAWISYDQIVGTLPKPHLVCKNNDLFYKFNKKITF